MLAFAPPLFTKCVPRPLAKVADTVSTSSPSVEPGTQAASVKDVVAQQFLAHGVHLLATDDADVVSGREVLHGDIRVERVHVPDRAARRDNVVERLLELPDRQVHRTNDEQWERVHLRGQHDT